MKVKILLPTLLLAVVLVLTSCFWVQTPVVTVTLSPVAGAVTTPVTITGSGFGAVQGTSVVTFDGIQAQILSWADTTITARVPVLGTPDGERGVIVDVVRAGQTIGTSPFALQRGVLFESHRDGNSEIYLMNPDGSNPVNLTQNAAFDYSATWSPDGTKVAFVSDRDGDNEIYVMNADGSIPVNVTQDPGSDTYPVWSPDGTRIAFQSDRESVPLILGVEPQLIPSLFNQEIFVMNANGTGLINVSNNAAYDGDPSWSPDGEHIVFDTDRDAEDGMILMAIVPGDLGREIYVVNADGGNPTNLSNSPEDDGYPVWSPDGSKIVFSSSRDGNWEIYTMNPDGSGQARLTHNSADDYMATWSPDSAWISFQSTRDGNLEIYKMTRDGLSMTRLTASTAMDWGPSWSLDSQNIVFQSNRDANAEIYRMSASGAFQERLTYDPDWDVHPVWGTPAWLPPS
jgi:Tol biopolymer transport system component